MTKGVKSIPVHPISGGAKKPMFPRLLIALRPWSFPAALSPLCITFAVLHKQSNLSLYHAIVFTIGILSLQASANLLNSLCDFRNGLDKFDTSGDRTMVDELVTKSEFPWLFTKLNLVWFLSFILTIPEDSETRSHYLMLYAAGFMISVLYSAGTFALKYIGLGDVAVFLSFGPLLVTASALACSLKADIVPTMTLLLLTVPASILVVGILHGNNHRDLVSDAKNKARTIAVRLGFKYSRIYFGFLVIAPVVLNLIAGMSYRREALLGTGILPFSLRLLKMVYVADHKAIPRDIDAETAKVMLLYGILTSLGLILV